MIKAHVSKVVLAVLDRTIQVCGALGYSSDLPVEEWYRGTRFGPDRRRARRAAQVGAGPHHPQGLHAGRGLADRAHPEPPPGGGGEVAGAAGRGRGHDDAPSAAAAVFFDFADTLFSSRDLRDAHLAQLRVVADAVGVHPTDDELRAAYRQGMGVGYRAVATRPYVPAPRAVRRARSRRWPRRSAARSTPPRATRSVDRQYAATIDAAVLRPDCLDTLRALRTRGVRIADRLEHRRRAARRAGGAARARRRRRHVDQLRVGAVVQARRPHLPGRARGRGVRRRRRAVRRRQRRARRRRAAGAGDAHRAARRRRPPRRRAGRWRRLRDRAPRRGRRARRRGSCAA